MTTQIFSLIPLIISIVSILISTYLAVRTVWLERFHIDFEFVKWFAASPKKYPFFVWLSVVNYSKTPCSIIEIKIIFKRNGEEITATGHGNRKPLIGGDEHCSLDYPVNLMSYGSVGGYFHLYTDSPFLYFEDSKVNLIVRTNRGKISKEVYFDTGKNLFRVNQANEEQWLKDMHHTDGSPVDYYSDPRL